LDSVTATESTPARCVSTIDMTRQHMTTHDTQHIHSSRLQQEQQEQL
jgi:hypothetical protein